MTDFQGSDISKSLHITDSRANKGIEFVAG